MQITLLSFNKANEMLTRQAGDDMAVTFRAPMKYSADFIVRPQMALRS